VRIRDSRVVRSRGASDAQGLDGPMAMSSLGILAAESKEPTEL
jgi:hypothetical protein